MANNAFKSNIYHKPGQAKYKSQFVPMPLDFMAKQIAGKQAKYDKQDLLMDKDALWDQVSLPGYDTKYVEDRKKQLTELQETFAGKDLGSSQVQKEYAKAMRKFRDDPDNKKVKAAVDLHNKYLARREELNKKGAIADAPVWFRDYEKKYKEYTKEGGLGFLGPGLGSHLITEGVDIREHAEKLYNNMGESGADYKKQLNNTGIYYEKGKVGISGKDISDKTRAGLRSFVEGPAGKQLSAEYDALVEDGMIDESKISKGDYIKDYLLGVGSERIHMKYTGTDAAALNTLRKEKKEADEKVVYAPTGLELDETESNKTTMLDLKNDMNDFDSKITEFEEQIAAKPVHMFDPITYDEQGNKIYSDRDKAYNIEVAKEDAYLNYLISERDAIKKTFDAEDARLDAAYDKSVDRASIINATPLKGTWMGDILSKSYSDPNQKQENISNIVNGTAASLGLEGDELNKFNIGMQATSENETLAAALQIFESGEGSNEAGTLFGFEVSEGGNLTYGNLQKLFNELGVDIDVTSDGLHSLGSTVIMKQESPQANSSKINYWRTKLIEGVAAQNGVNFKDITSIDGKVQYEKNNILNDFTTNFSQIATSQLDKDKWKQNKIASGEGGVVNYNHNVGLGVPKGDLVIYKNGSTKTFKANDKFIEADMNNNASSWGLYSRDGRPLEEALLGNEAYTGFIFDLSQISDAKVDKLYGDKKERDANGKVVGEVGEGYTFNVKIPYTYTKANGDIGKGEIRRDIYATEPVGNNGSYANETRMYQKENRDQAYKINPLSEVVKNYAYDKDSRSSSRITSQLITQKETASTELANLALNYVLNDAGATMKTVPVYRGGMVDGFDAVFSLTGKSEDAIEKYFTTEDDIDEFLNDMTNLVQLAETGELDQKEINAILDELLK